MGKRRNLKLLECPLKTTTNGLLLTTFPVSLPRCLPNPLTLTGRVKSQYNRERSLARILSFVHGMRTTFANLHQLCSSPCLLTRYATHTFAGNTPSLGCSRTIRSFVETVPGPAGITFIHQTFSVPLMLSLTVGLAKETCTKGLST